MSRNQHRTANGHPKHSRGGRLMAKLGLGRRRKSLARLRRELIK